MWPNEIIVDNSVWINPETAAIRGIGDGDRIKIETELGEIEADAKVTENVVPGTIAMSSHGGRWEYGRYASGKKKTFGVETDHLDEELKWWSNGGTCPDWIIDNASEPISSQQRWMDTVVSVKKV